MATDPIQVFVSPTERHPSIKNLGRASMLPEDYGCDVAWRANGQWWGVQRKEVSDFIASVQDGRLAKEIGQMRGRLAIPMIVIEGKVQWDNNGNLISKGYGMQITQQQWHGMLFAITYQGVAVLFTATTPETAVIVTSLTAWSQKDNHTSLLRRPGPDKTSMWGTVDNKDWARHLLQGFPGIGPQVAQDIIDHFGGIPLQWTVTPAQMMKVKGLGKGRIKTLMEAFQTPPATTP